VSLQRMLDITAGLPVREPEGTPPDKMPEKPALRVLTST